MKPFFALLKIISIFAAILKKLMINRTQKGNPRFYSGYMSAIESFFLNSGTYYLII